MRKTILYEPQQAGMDDMFSVEHSDPAFAPWRRVRELFNEIGFDIVTPAQYKGQLEAIEWVIFQNIPLIEKRSRWHIKSVFRKRDFFESCIKAGLSKRLAVILYEPPVVKLENYEKYLHEKFTTVFTWDKTLLEKKGRYSEFVFIQPSHPKPYDTSDFYDRKLLCNFSANKKSDHPLELYSERLNFIRFMEKKAPSDFDHYGRGWETGFPLWKGRIKDKITVMSNYRFNLCYENMSDTSGYVTEKIFDSFTSGAVPIYWGAENI